MERPLLRINRPVCRACQASVRSRTAASVLSPFFAPSRQTRQKSTSPPWSRSSPSVHREVREKTPFPRQQPDTLPDAFNQPQRQATSGIPPTATELANVQDLADVVLTHSAVPTENETLAALRAIEYLAARSAGIQTKSASSSKSDSNTPASVLLAVDPRTTPADPQKAGTPTATIDLLSNLAYDIVKHPSVFISPKVLEVYTTIQALLLRPDSFPEIFTLYATKPIPEASSRSTKSSSTSPVQIKYHTQSPTALSSAIPTNLITLALTTATRTRSLPLALNIIESSLSTPAFRRNKLFRRALPPCTLASFAPLAAYALATNLSHYQNALPPENFTAIAFAGLLTYATAVGTIGYVALTTSNDQMERVTWATGMPLWERWVREEERAAVDQVVRSWGFRERWRWGEEEGVEWEGLKDWAGLRGMVVDRVGLMEGME